MGALDTVGRRFRKETGTELTMQEYLDLCKSDPSAHASPCERMLKAIGEPVIVKTIHNERLSRKFRNRVLRTWECFKDFYGAEDTMEQVVDYFKHAAQGLEESKQILYLLGPVAGGKSTLASKLVELMEQEPFYAIKGSPVNDNPLCLFNKQEHGEELQSEYGIPVQKLNSIPSPWLIKRLREADGDTSWIRVVRRYPSKVNQIAVSRTEPGDDKNQDQSVLIGKLDIRQIEKYSQSDADAYDYSGALCTGNRGIFEFVEMFKAPINILNPLLTATQEKSFNGNESGMSQLPFDGIILAHSNESEWETFRNDRRNEAFIDRVYLIKVPYTLSMDDETRIYEKLLRESQLTDAPCAPKTLEMLATFSVISRLFKASSVTPLIKARIYNGENVKDKVNTDRSLLELKLEAGVTEGMREGISPRFAFKILSKTFNHDPDEIAANPVHLMNILTEAVRQQQFPKQKEDHLLWVIESVVRPLYNEYLFNELQMAYLDSHEDYGQNVFDKYLTYCDFWREDGAYQDPETGNVLKREELHKYLRSIEEGAGIHEYEVFRTEVLMFCMRAKAKNGGSNPKWTAYEKLAEVIKKKVLSNWDEILPVISFDAKRSESDEKKHQSFVSKMKALGYTEKQVKILTQYRAQKPSQS